MSHFFSPFDENALHYDNCVQFLEDSAVEDGAFLPLVVSLEGKKWQVLRTMRGR
jgi:hypothetical protein